MTWRDEARASFQAVLDWYANGCDGGYPISAPNESTMCEAGLRALDALDARDALLRKVVEAVSVRRGSTCDVPWPLIERIERTLAEIEEVRRD